MFFTTSLKNSTSGGKSNQNKAYVWYFVSVIIGVLIGFLVYIDAFPIFFVLREGPTLLRQIVLGMGTLFIAISCLLLYKLYLVNKSKVLYWFFLGLVLTILGLVAIFVQESVGSVIGWIGRIAQYIAGIYFLIALKKVK